MAEVLHFFFLAEVLHPKCAYFLHLKIGLRKISLHYLDYEFRRFFVAQFGSVFFNYEKLSERITNEGTVSFLIFIN